MKKKPVSTKNGHVSSHLREECKNKGLRLTRQRAVIIDLLDSAEGHLDARELLEAARLQIPDIDKTTVYRTIRKLRLLGLIDELDLLHFQHEGHFYEPLRGKMHLHAVCLGCGLVLEPQPESWQTVEHEVEESTGFSITMARVEMGGYCPRCRKKS